MPSHRRPRKTSSAARSDKGRLRRNVGLVIINEQGLVLAGLRTHASGDKVWQMPQGGIEGKEHPLTAAYREIREETGLTGEDIDFMREMPVWTVYYLPKEWARGRRFVGQKQKWFAFKYLRTDVPDIALAHDHEFEALQWVEPTWLVEHVIDFRKAVYRDVFHAFADVISGWKKSETPAT